MRTAAFISWFVPLFILYIALIVVYDFARVIRIKTAERKAQLERERIAAQRRAKAEARKREQAAARAAKATEAAAQPPRKRGRPRKNPPAAVVKSLPEPKPAAPVPIEPPKPNAAQMGAFSGEIVAFTGTCPKMQRRDMVSHVIRLGGQGCETINTRCTLLVVGVNPGKNQLDRAAKWNVPTITWEEWWLRTFNSSAVVKPESAADEPITIDQFAALLASSVA